MTEEYDEAIVSSSIFYAKKNTPSKQNFLLNLDQETSEISQYPYKRSESPLEVDKSLISKDRDTDRLEEKTSSKKTIEKTKKGIKVQKPKYKQKILSQYYPDLTEPEKTPLKKKLTKKGKVKASPTKLHLTSALNETKKRIKAKSEKRTSTKLQTKKITVKELKIQKKIKTIKLNEFVSEKRIKIQRPIIPDEMKTPTIQTEENKLDEKREKSSLHQLKDTDPFPFTRLAEWLIWHRNYPELDYVREAYDVEEVPEDSDEVFWVNIMNEPEFFYSSWKIAGLKIDGVNALKFQGRPDGLPEWDIDQGLTDGFYTFFKDVFNILQYNTNGMKNYRYPILLLALKGLVLLDLVYLDKNSNRWFIKASNQEMITRIRELDYFMSQQETIEGYQQYLKNNRPETTPDWKLGIICFDLVIMRSLFLSTFFRSRIEEETKYNLIKQEGLMKILMQKLPKVEILDHQRVRSLLKILEPFSS